MTLAMEQCKVFHKDMWLEIEFVIRSSKKCVIIYRQKEVYIRTILPEYVHIHNRCFLCDYAFGIKAAKGILDWDMCDFCLARESQSTNKGCLNGLYEKCVNSKDWKEQADLAHQIACICD